MIKAKRWGRIRRRNQQNLGSQKIDRDDVAEHRKLKSKYLRNSRSRRSQQMDSAESGKDQEIKTPGVLKGGVSSRAKTCRTGIMSKAVSDTSSALSCGSKGHFLSPLEYGCIVFGELEQWLQVQRHRPSKRDTNVSLESDDEGNTYNLNNETLLTQCTTRSLSPPKSSDCWLQDS